MKFKPDFVYLIKLLQQKLPSAEMLAVGGCVRDYLLGLEPKDIDVEFYNIQPQQLEQALTELNVKFDLVGKTFGVYKVYYEGETYDFSFPRKETKESVGYKGFSIEIDPFLTYKEACSRRDLTINAIMFDLKTGQYVDPFHGKEDLEQKRLVPTTEKFKEDPLRVLRVMQFLSRFDGFEVSDRLSIFCEDLLQEKDALVKERVWVEWEKMLLKGTNILKPLNFLFVTDWLESELEDLVQLEQDQQHHPEIFVFRHTVLVAQHALEVSRGEGLTKEETIVLILSAICHDMGKINTTKINEEGRIVSPGHADTSVPLALSFLDKIGCPLKYHKPICTLVENHMAHLVPKVTSKMVRRLNNKLVKGETTINQLCLLIECDYSGRPPKPKGMPEKAKQILEVFSSLDIKPNQEITKLVTGKDLIQLGVKPGLEMGKILDELYEKQLDGDFSTKEEGIILVKQTFSL